MAGRWANWFFPKRIAVPSCVDELLKFVYPTVDWSTVRFHEGWPHLTKLRDKKALTLPSAWYPKGIDIYFKKGEFDPCTCDGLGLIVHEGFHVLQLQEVAGGARLGLLGPVTMLYLACWANNGFSYDDHPAEKAAYRVAGKSTSLFAGCCAPPGGLPCDCDCDPPGLDRGGLQALMTACSNLPQTSSDMKFWEDLWDCTPGLEWLYDHIWWFAGIYFAVWFIVALVATIVVWVLKVVVEVIGAIGSAFEAVGRGIWDLISSPFSSSKRWIWYTTFDGGAWQIPDISVTQNDHTKTSDRPSAATFRSNLYIAYRSSGSSDLWYNFFDGTDWQDPDIEITRDGRTRTSLGPALAEFNGSLYMAYRASDDSDIWYNVFDGTDWLDDDIEITKNGHTRTSRSPALAEFNGSLYMAYRDAGSSDIWYNVFDGTNWRDEDCRISRDDRVKTAEGPSLAVVPVGATPLMIVYRDDS